MEKLSSITSLLADISSVVAARLSTRKAAAPADGQKRVTIVQFGDYADAVRKFARGESETYYAQRFSVEAVASLASRDDIASVTVIQLSSDAPVETMPSGVQTAGLLLYPAHGPPRYRDLIEAVQRTAPTHLVVASPILQLIAWGVRQGISVLPMFADSFQSSSTGARLRSRLLGFLLGHPSIPVVANHNLAAALELQRIGVGPDKIVPFDWPAVVDPSLHSAKQAPPENRPFRLLFVGIVSVEKGVGDAIEAIALLRKGGSDVELTIIGRGDLQQFKEQAEARDIADRVFLLGPKSHPEVLVAMRDHDAVLVPSRWSYPEGLPMTLYESLCSRTPLLTSDHPMFKLKIRDGYNALVFPEQNPAAMAGRVSELRSSPELYTKLSAVAAEAAAGFLCPLKFDRLLYGFLDPAARDELRSYSLARYAYFTPAA